MDTQASDDKITDAALIGEKVGISHEEAMHWGELTEEELHIEKKLRLKIDMLVMPLVILVYLMNYIDRYAMPHSTTPMWNTHAHVVLQEQLCGRSIAGPRAGSTFDRGPVPSRLEYSLRGICEFNNVSF